MRCPDPRSGPSIGGTQIRCQSLAPGPLGSGRGARRAAWLQNRQGSGFGVTLQIPRLHGLGSIAQATDSLAPSPLAGEGWGEGSERLRGAARSLGAGARPNSAGLGGRGACGGCDKAGVSDGWALFPIRQGCRSPPGEAGIKQLAKHRGIWRAVLTPGPAPMAGGGTNIAMN
jgi:hypothetical protein